MTCRHRIVIFFFSSRRRHTRWTGDWSSDVCSSDLDVVMPEMNGRELAERLAAQRPETKVLYMSGYTDHAVVHHGVLAPRTEFLQKPFTEAVLTRKLRELLDA